jgi:hypothetical protein
MIHVDVRRRPGVLGLTAVMKATIVDVVLHFSFTFLLTLVNLALYNFAR